MFLIPVILATAGLSVPEEIRDAVRPLSFATHPNGSSASGKVTYALTIDPGGRPIECRIVASSGSTDIDTASCDGAKQRFRFEPARDGVSQTQYGLVRQQVIWKGGRVTQRFQTSLADLVLRVNRLPSGWTRFGWVGLAILVDKDGRVTRCERAGDQAVHPSSDLRSKPGITPDDHAWRLACDAVPKLLPILVAHDRAGTPVTSIQGVSVAFELDAAAVPRSG